VNLEFPRWLTLGAVVGIVLGFSLGAAANLHPGPFLDGVGALAGPVGRAWTRALLLVVVPLIMCQLVLAASGDGVKKAARIGGVSLAVFVAMMVASALYTYVLGRPLIQGTPADAGAFAQAVEEAGDLGIVSTEMAQEPVGFGESLVNMIPDNIFGAAARGDLISLILVSALFGFAVSAIGPQKEQILSLVRAFRDAVFVATYWVILALPVGAFALAYDVAARTGLALAGVLGYYLAIHIGLLILLVLLLYPFTMVVGGVGLGRFARAVWPAQGVAMTTRSSLASLPALMAGARSRLGLPEDVVSLSLPLGASTFKMNTLVSSFLKILFLAHLYGIGLDPAFMLLFVGTQILTSPSVPGIPSGGYVMTLPLYVAVGIPVEGVILLKAMDAVPDIFKTLLNSTAYMTSAVVVARLTGWKAAEATRPAPV
jgi:Na+/H+-dicarboxylate symporter